MLYLFQVIIYTGLLCLVYILFLRNKPMHGFNRVYLLNAAILPLLLPFIRFPQMQQQLKRVNYTEFRLPEITVSPTQQPTIYHTLHTVWIVYLVISLILTCVFVWHWYKLKRIVDIHTKEQQDGYVLIANSGYGPGSWFKYVFLPGGVQNKAIIEHERAHVQLGHSWDTVLLNALQCILWPNVFLHWLRKELVLVHEFQADAVVKEDSDTYAALLVSNIFGRCTLPGTHSFIVHPIKRRIMMLKKRSSVLPRIVATVLTLGATGFLLLNVIALQSCKEKNWELEKKNAVEGTFQSEEQTVKFTMETDEPLTKAEVMPEFKGGSAELMQYMSQNLKYPKEAIEKNLQGRVIVNFVVEDDGSISSAAVAKSPDPLLSEAALAMVNSMPAWTPGLDHGKQVAVKYALPIMFKLED